MDTPFGITTGLLDQIDRLILSHPPERGGALMGPIGIPLVTELLYDGHAEVTSVTYEPSRWLNSEVKRLEMEGILEFKGILHSHPSSLDHPSGPDEVEVTKGLSVNQHMSHYLVPIATHRQVHAPRPHETPTNLGIVSWFTGIRGASDRADIRPLLIEVITNAAASEYLLRQPHTQRPNNTIELPLLADLRSAAQYLETIEEPRVFLTDIEDRSVPAGQLTLPGDTELLVLASERYPFIPPVVLVTHSQETEQLDLSWNLLLPPDLRFLTAIKDHFSPPGPYVRLWGPAPGTALTHDRQNGEAARWRSFYGCDTTATHASRLQSGLLARSSNIVSSAITNRTVTIVGLGSVGSYIAEVLARQGVGHIIAIDPDAVEPENISRTIYDITDVHTSKANALARHLLNCNPSIQYEPHVISLQMIERESLVDIMKRTDLLIAATDDLRAQRICNHFAYSLGVPGVFIGIYAGAQGGEVILTVPEQTACYLCATASRHDIEREAGRVAPQSDYGTGRLVAELALATDIQHVSTAAAKAALSFLSTKDTLSSLGHFLSPVLASGDTYLTFSTVPDYWFYPNIFNNVPGQFAYQSVCLTPTRRDDCPVCGAVPTREDPQVAFSQEDLEALRSAVANQPQAINQAPDPIDSGTANMRLSGDAEDVDIEDIKGMHDHHQDSDG